MIKSARLNLGKRPLAIFVVVFACGIFFASRFKITFFFIYFLGWIFLAVAFILRNKEFSSDFFLLAAIFLFASGLLSNVKILTPCHILRYVSHRNNTSYVVKGHIDNEPESKDRYHRFIIQTENIKSGDHAYRCVGKVLVYLKSQKNLSYGQGLILKGNLSRPFRFGQDKRKNYRDYLYRQGIRLIMRVKSDVDIIVLRENGGSPLKRFSLKLKKIIEGKIYSCLSLGPGAILDAMILGDKKNIPMYIYNAMMKSGTVHILVVSGFNVGIVALAVTLILKFIRLPRKIAYCITVPILVIYCFVTGASAPVVRATTMAIVFICANLIRRQPDIYNSLSIAALFILANNPWQLFDIGFQLSFASVLAIIYLYPKIKSLLPVSLFKIRYLRTLIEAGLVSFSAWLGTMCLIIYYFRIFAPVTVLANILIVPLATLITLSGFTLIAIGSILPALAPLFATACAFLVTLLVNINAWLIKLPCAYFYLSPKT